MLLSTRKIFLFVYFALYLNIRFTKMCSKEYVAKKKQLEPDELSVVKFFTDKQAGPTVRKTYELKCTVPFMQQHTNSVSFIHIHLRMANSGISKKNVGEIRNK